VRTSSDNACAASKFSFVCMVGYESYNFLTNSKPDSETCIAVAHGLGITIYNIRRMIKVSQHNYCVESLALFYGGIITANHFTCMYK
jgi:hypothetical protein